MKKVLDKLEKPMKELTWLVYSYNEACDKANKDKCKGKIKGWMKCHEDIIDSGLLPDEIVKDLCKLVDW